MNFNFNFNFGKSRAESFSEFCTRAGYPAPFEKQIDFMRFAFEQNQNGPSMLLGFRGSGKTDYVSILGVAKKLYDDPNFKILMVTKENERGKEIVSEVREVMERNGAKFKNKAKKKLILKGASGKEPNLLCLTIRSRGFRGRHPDLIIMEDPITPEDTSATERKRVKKVYEELYKLTPNLFIIGQPVHKLDLYQELRDVIPTYFLRWGDIPELSKDLEAQRKAGVSEESIQASYFLNIMDDLSLPFGKIETVEYYGEQNIAYIDPSHKGGDYTAMAVGGVKFNKVPVVGFAFQKAWYDCLEEFAEIFKRYNVGRVCVETNGLGEMPVIEMNKIGIPACGHNSTKKKHERILNAAQFINDLKLVQVLSGKPELIQGNKIFIDLVKNYEYKIEHDDPPDALAGLLVFMGVLNE